MDPTDSENLTQTASRVEADCRASLLRRRVVGSRHEFMPFCWDAAPLSRVQCLECNGRIVTPIASIFWDDGCCESGFDHDCGLRNSIICVCLAARREHGSGSQWASSVPHRTCWDQSFYYFVLSRDIRVKFDEAQGPKMSVPFYDSSSCSNSLSRPPFAA